MRKKDRKKEEDSLLLFLETQATDYGGKVGMVHMNAADIRIAEEWNKEGYIGFGRVASGDLTRSPRQTTHWVRLSEEAWEDVHRLRRERAKRMWSNRKWKTTKEKRGEE